VFAILTLYPQPTHLEYGKSLPQAQHHPSIHPLLNILPQPPHPHPHSQHPKHHSLTSMLHNPPPPHPPTFPHQTQTAALFPNKKKKNHPRRTSCITVAARSVFFFFFFLRIRRRARFSPFAALLSQSIYPYFTLTVPDFRISKIEGPPSANFALQSTNSLEKPNHHPTDL